MTRFLCRIFVLSAALHIRTPVVRFFDRQLGTGDWKNERTNAPPGDGRKLNYQDCLTLAQIKNQKSRQKLLNLVCFGHLFSPVLSWPVSHSYPLTLCVRVFVMQTAIHKLCQVAPKKRKGFKDQQHRLCIERVISVLRDSS